MENQAFECSNRKQRRLPIPDFSAPEIDSDSSESLKSTLSPVDMNGRGTFAGKIGRTIRRGWANWPKIEKGRLDAKFTIRMKDHCLMYTNQASPCQQFSDAMRYMDELQSMRRQDPEIAAELMAKAIEEDMILVIFGSNLIERAGETLDETKRLCEIIFRGEMVEPNERSLEYEHNLENWILARQNGADGVEHTIRKRNEVIQHAYALQFITDAVLAQDKPFSEQLLKETHKILLTGVDHPKYKTPWEEYAGVYRDQVRQPGSKEMGAEVHAGDTHFTPSKRVPDTMARIVRELNADIAKAEDSRFLDPYPLAAKYCADFVWCHPFLDGNGRLCRLLLNAILLKYAGIVVPIGEHDEERTEYLEIKRRYTQECTGEGEFAAMILKRATIRLKAMKERVREGLNHQ